MSQQTDNLGTLLTKLGEAHQHGVFQSRVNPYPWLAVEHDGSLLAVRRFAWVRVAIPLAAAAAVAVLFVGPSLWSPPAVNDQVAQNALAPDLAAKPAPPERGTGTTTPVAVSDCDYNHDGVVDGKDIQAMIDRLNVIGGQGLADAISKLAFFGLEMN